MTESVETSETGKRREIGLEFHRLLLRDSVILPLQHLEMELSMQKVIDPVTLDKVHYSQHCSTL